VPARDRSEAAVVPSPSADAPVAEPRPALALTAAAASSSRANGRGVFATITIAERGAWPGDVLSAAWREVGPGGAPSVPRREPSALDRPGRPAAGDEEAVARGSAPPPLGVDRSPAASAPAA
jgi:hypothetical protein